MLTSSFFIFCRRSSILKPPVLISHVSKYAENNGSYKYSKSYTKRLFQRQVCETNSNQYNVRNLKGQDAIKRYKQTSSEKSSKDSVSDNVEESPENLSLFKRYRKMLKEYWYVLLPVHFIIAPFWLGGFYYAAKCGIDIVPFLEFIKLPEKWIEPLRNSSLGYIAVASAFYKLATPARYMVTLGGTTFAVRFLTKRGLIKPVPSKKQLKTIIQSKLKKDITEKKS